MSNKYLDINGLSRFWEAIKTYVGGKIMQTDWTQRDSTADDYIKNKPSIIKGAGTLSIIESAASTATGQSSHAEGYFTNADGDYSHAEGCRSYASGQSAHAEGLNTRATGTSSHAQNTYTIAAKPSQTAIGAFNIEDTEAIAIRQKAFIIGNGTSESRSNAYAIDWQGNSDQQGRATTRDMTQEELAAFLEEIPPGSTIDYVKKSGDTMTGSLKFNGYGARDVGILLSGDELHANSNIDIGWNHGNLDGAQLALCSVDFGSEGIAERLRGSFLLTARSEVGTKQLIGQTNGDLFWDNKKVLHNGLEPTFYDYSSFTYNTGFTYYSNTEGNNNTPEAYKFGKIVNLSGCFKTTAAQSSTTEVTMGYVPSGCKPIKEIRVVQQGTDMNRFLLQVKTTGALTISRYGTTTNTPFPNNVWINISCTYISAT